MSREDNKSDSHSGLSINGKEANDLISQIIPVIRWAVFLAFILGVIYIYTDYKKAELMQPTSQSVYYFASSQPSHETHQIERND